MFIILGNGIYLIQENMEKETGKECSTEHQKFSVQSNHTFTMNYHLLFLIICQRNQF